MADTIVHASFHGATFSERIWGAHQDYLHKQLTRLLSDGLILGKSSRELAVQLRKVTGSTKKQAQRLMRTEMVRVQIAAEHEAYKQCGFTQYEFLTNPGCCDECKALDHEVFELDEMMTGDNAPPLHPNCRCFTAPTMDRKKVEKDLGIDKVSDQDVIDFDEWADSYDKHGLSWQEWKEGKRPSIVLPKSIGARWSNYDVMDLETGDYYQFQEGSKITNIQVYAGKGVKTPYRKAEKMAERYGGTPSNWKHVKGFGIIETDEVPRKVEAHWSE